MKRSNRISKALLTFATGATLAVSTGCLPDDFYVDLWATILTNTATTLVDGIVTSAL